MCDNETSEREGEAMWCRLEAFEDAIGKFYNREF